MNNKTALTVMNFICAALCAALVVTAKEGTGLYTFAAVMAISGISFIAGLISR